MTYCVAISVSAGMVFCSDSRTNAGVDQVSTYSKMFRFELGPERQFVILTAGNLATTQASMAQLKKDIRQGSMINLNTVGSVGEAADYLGEVSKAQQDKHGNAGQGFGASFILGGQIAGSEHRIVLIYPEGNHITSSKDTPYLQIGESKYGKPILDRIINLQTPLETAALCALVSMDSTMRSNLSVGPPIEVIQYTTNSFNLQPYYRFAEDSDYLRELKKSWDNRLKEAFHLLPPLDSQAIVVGGSEGSNFGSMQGNGGTMPGMQPNPSPQPGMVTQDGMAAQDGMAPLPQNGNIQN